MKQELVKEWMSTDLIIAPPDMTLPEAGTLMSERGIRRLPVVDKKNRLLGIVTRGDVREARPSDATTLSIWEINYLLARIQVKEIMTADPITVAPDDTIGKAARLMAEKKISGLPVVADGKLAGIITESDIFRLVAKHWAES